MEKHLTKVQRANVILTIHRDLLPKYLKDGFSEMDEKCEKVITPPDPTTEDALRVAYTDMKGKYAELSKKYDKLSKEYEELLNSQADSADEAVEEVEVKETKKTSTRRRQSK